MEYRFPAYNKSPGVVIGFIIYFVCLFPFLFMGEAITWELFIPGIFLLFFGYVLVASAFKLFITYYISENALRIVKPPFHRISIARTEIKQLVLVTDKEAEQLMENMMMEQNEFAATGDLIGYINYLRKHTPTYKYFTFAPTMKMTTVGPRDLITSMKVTSTTQYIILTLSNDKVLFLSPKDPIGFMEKYNKLSPNKGAL